MIINEVLTFAIYCNNSNCIDNCKKVMLSFYSDDEIKSAKRSLWMDCSKDIKNVFQNRITTETRTASSANIDDIMEAIIHLDAKGKLPDVVAKDIGRLPDRQPEELNKLYIIKELAELKKAKQNHEDVLSDIKIDVLKLQDDAKKKCNIKESNEDNNTNRTANEDNNNTTNAAAKQDTSENSEDNNTSANVSSERDDSERSTSKQVPRVEGKRWGPQRKIAKPISSQQKSQTTQQEQPNIINPVPALNNHDTTTSQGRQNQQATGNINIPNNGLEGAPPPERTIFLSRVNTGDINSIKKFLKDRNVNAIDIVKASHSQAKFKSFKIKITLLDLHKVLNDTFWPRGILCNKWRDPTPRNNYASNFNYEFDY